jgi:hypothetical protein
VLSPCDWHERHADIAVILPFGRPVLKGEVIELEPILVFKNGRLGIDVENAAIGM